MSAVENDGWYKACETSSCVEVKPVNGGALLRGSEDPDVQLQLTSDMLAGMFSSIKAGAWDLPTSAGDDGQGTV